MKKKVLPVIVVVALIAIIVGIMGLSSLIKKYTPSKERQDLTEYYHINSNDQVAILLNDEMIDTSARLIGGYLYVDYRFVRDRLNERFFWDENENILLYATPRELISAEADSNRYLVTKSAVDYGRPIVKATSDSAYVDLDFVRQYSDFTCEKLENPNRIILTNRWGEYETATVKRNTYVRVLGGIKSPILVDAPEKSTVTVIARDESWTKVMTEDGIVGYIQTQKLSSPVTQIRESEYTPEAFTHISKDFKICMAWHQVTNRTANSDVASVLANTKGINVISPTWFYLNDNSGGLMNLADNDYVNYCHSQGIEVWALVSNLENKDVDSAYVLTHTSTRQNLVNQIVSMALQYNLDGINLDFEALNQDAVGDSYIQFVRELSIKCANNGIVLSIDNYTPSSYTAFYNRAEQANYADYVVIMGYDEHYAGSEEGSVSSLPWVRKGVSDTLLEVPANQVILGMPFYTRVWTLTPSVSSEDSDVDLAYEVTSKAYGMNAAESLIANHGAEKQWLADTGQNYAEFESGGAICKVWLEDAASAEGRLKLMQEYGLAGASFWKLGLEKREIWDTVIKYIN